MNSPKPPSKPRRLRDDRRWAWVLLLPGLAGLIVFLVVPVAWSLAMAFTNYDLLGREPLTFVGLDNFRDLLWGERSAEFGRSAMNTLYLMMGLPASIAGSLVLAMLIHRTLTWSPGRRHLRTVAFLAATGTLATLLLAVTGRSDGAFWMAWLTIVATAGGVLGAAFFRTLFYLPQVTAGVASYILWKNIYNPESGIINLMIQRVAETLGLAPVTPPQWLLSVQNLWALAPEQLAVDARFFGLGARDAILYMGIWGAIGGVNMFIYLAALANIPQQLYDAASVDGAGAWQRFRRITWPMLSSTTFLVAVLSLIGAVQGGFEQARVMTGGGPAGTTVTLGYYLFDVGFQEFRMGMASAVCWILFAMVFVMTMLGWRYGQRDVFE